MNCLEEVVRFLGRKPTALLVEDDTELRNKYEKSLTEAGFQVTPEECGFCVEETARRERFDVIVSDTDLIKGNDYPAYGDEIFKGLLKEGLIRNTLLIGISQEHGNRNGWREVAHEFYEKSRIEDIGQIAIARLYNFLIGTSPLHRTRLLKIQA